MVFQQIGLLAIVDYGVWNALRDILLLLLVAPGSVYEITTNHW